MCVCSHAGGDVARAGRVKITTPKWHQAASEWDGFDITPSEKPTLRACECESRITLASIVYGTVDLFGLLLAGTIVIEA